METPKQRPGRNGGTLQTGFKSSEEAAKAARAKKQLPELKEIAASALSEEKGGITAAEKILQAHIKQAQAGDVASANFVFGYAYGKPTQRTEVTGADGGAISFTLAPADPEQLAGLDIQTDAE